MVTLVLLVLGVLCRLCLVYVLFRISLCIAAKLDIRFFANRLPKVLLVLGLCGVLLF